MARHAHVHACMRTQVGHALFWHLKAEVHDPPFCERLSLVLEEYLSHAGRHGQELRKQTAAVLKLQKVAEMIVHFKRDLGYQDAELMKEYQKEVWYGLGREGEVARWMSGDVGFSFLYIPSLAYMPFSLSFSLLSLFFFFFFYARLFRTA